MSALAGAIDLRYEAAIYLLAYGGFRIGELAAWRIEDVDWAREGTPVNGPAATGALVG